MSHPQRKKTYVDPNVQGSLTRRLIFHWLGFLAVSSFVAFCLQVFSNPLQSVSQHVENLWWTHGPFLLVMVFLLPVFVLDTIRISHRFAGPIYRLRQTIRSIADGKPTKRLKFRDFDFWQGLAEDFNQMVDRLSNHEVEMLDHELDHEEAGSLETIEAK